MELRCDTNDGANEKSNVCFAYFDSFPRPFILKRSMCVEPDCTCNNVFFHFTEADNKGDILADPISFEVGVEIDSWEEPDPPDRPEFIKVLVQEFLADYPPAGRLACREHLLACRQKAQIAAARHLDADEIKRGILVPFSKILNQKQLGLRDNDSFAYCFVHEGYAFFVEDFYCAKPECPCENVHLEFMWTKTKIDASPRKAPPARNCFMARISLKNGTQNKPAIVDISQFNRKFAERILAKWWSLFSTDIERLQQRYQVVKKIGGYCLANKRPSPKKHNRRIDTPEPTVAEPKVGRNALCPCGSGKKYKKCCGRLKTTS